MPQTHGSLPGALQRDECRFAGMRLHLVRAGRGPETRLSSAWYGTGKTRKLQALELATEFANAA